MLVRCRLPSLPPCCSPGRHREPHKPTRPPPTSCFSVTTRNSRTRSVRGRPCWACRAACSWMSRSTTPFRCAAASSAAAASRRTGRSTATSPWSRSKSKRGGIAVHLRLARDDADAGRDGRAGSRDAARAAAADPGRAADVHARPGDGPAMARRRPRFEHDTWINWQRLNTAEHRERFDAGYRARVGLTPAGQPPGSVAHRA